MHKQFMITLALCSTMLFGFVCSASTAETAITVLTGPSAGTQEVVGAAASEIWKNNIPDAKFSAVPTGGTSVNINLMDQGDGEVVMITGEVAAAAVSGQAPFKKQYAELRGIFATYPNTYQVWVQTDKGINDFGDLINKKITFGQPGGGPYQPSLNMMNVFGFKMTDMKDKGGRVLPYAWGEAVNALADGNIDAVLWTTSFPAARIVDAEITREFKLLQINSGKLEAFKNKYKGWVDVKIPAGTYRGQAADVMTIGTPNFFGCKASLSEDLVYAMTRALWKNRDILGNTHALLKGITEETVARGMVAPLHPGAKRFYKEMNIPMDDE